MSKLVVMYVYSPTEYTTDTKIETIDGGVLSPDRDHRVTLPAGIYRFLESAKVTPMQNKSDGFHRVSFTKGDFPDPPAKALEDLHKTTDQIRAFANSAGRVQTI
jgi:hypothetical protein